MAVIQSRVQPGSSEFRERSEAMLRLLEDLQNKVKLISQGAVEKAQQKHLAKGKLLPRDRVALLLIRVRHFLNFRNSRHGKFMKISFPQRVSLPESDASQGWSA